MTKPAVTTHIYEAETFNATVSSIKY